MIEKRVEIFEEKYGGYEMKTEGYLISLMGPEYIKKFQEEIEEVISETDYTLTIIPDTEYEEKDFELIISTDKKKLKSIDDFLEGSEKVERYEKGWRPLWKQS